MPTSQKIECALTIAGFDPSGGAGILADVRTFTSFGVQAVAVVTSLTFQNRARIFGAVPQTGEAVRAQVLPLLDDFKIVCAKTGMLPTREVVLQVARLFQETHLPRPVVDPILVSSSGHRLMEEDAREALIKELLPVARLVTPNIPEAETLSGVQITSETDMRRAAGIIRELGAAAVLIKGGHLVAQGADGEGQDPNTSGQWAVGSRQQEVGRQEKGSGEAQDELGEAIDVLDNEGRVTVFREQRVSGADLHGSGCILSSAIAAGLGNGLTLEDSVGAAKSFVLELIRNA